MAHEMDRSLVAIAIIVIAVIVVGEAYVYGGMTDVEIRASGDGGYSISDNGTDAYDAMLMDRHGFPAIRSLTILYDADYADVSEISFVEIGSPELNQKSYVERLSNNLDMLGFSDHRAIDAKALEESLRADLDSSSCSGKGLAVVSGALPDTIYDGTSSSLVLQWISAGGSLYFVGAPVGKLVGHNDGTYDDIGTKGQSLFIEASGWNDEESKATGSSSLEWRDSLLLRSLDLQHSPNLEDVPDSLGLGYDDGKYSTISMVRHGSGQVCVFGGGHSDMQRQDLATIVASSMCYCAEFVDHDHGEVIRGTVEGRLDMPSDIEDATIYSVVGGFFTVQGRSFHF